MKTVPFTTGELRASLQRIVFIRLSADLSEDFKTGDVVAAQYWGNGKVVVTRPDGKTIVPVAHMISGQFIVDFDQDPHVINIHVSSPADVPSVDPAQTGQTTSTGYSLGQPGGVEAKSPTRSTPDWSKVEADAENGAGMP